MNALIVMEPNQESSPDYVYRVSIYGFEIRGEWRCYWFSSRHWSISIWSKYGIKQLVIWAENPIQDWSKVIDFWKTLKAL